MSRPVAPQAGYFGDEDAALFGWLHAPASPGADLGVVVCNPFGFEEVCAHRSLRHFAQAASEAGLPSLRFDYAGCGQSHGDEFEPDLFAKWVRSVHQAIDAFKAATGVRRVVLLGLRLGAMLAALAACERDDVAAMVAIAPVVRGRGYVRELSLLGQTGAAPAGPAAAGAPLESAGFAMTRETADALAQVDLRAFTRAPAPRVLIVPRDDLATETDWATALREQGAAVEVERWPGYAKMMADPQRALVPEGLVGAVTRRLQAWAREAAPMPSGCQARVLEASLSSSPLRRQLALTVANESVVETPVQIPTGTDPSRRLVGILTLPAAAASPGAARQAVLMLNAGAVHGIGPNRLWVGLARRWAARGLIVLRVDIAGLGDSPAHEGECDNVVYSAHALQDVAAALGYLHDEAGADACHLVGLCSGAYHALKSAIGDASVASAVVINPLTYDWAPGTPLDEVKEYEMDALTTKFRDKLYTREPWLKLLRGQLDVRLVRQVAVRRVRELVAAPLVGGARVLRIPLRRDLGRDLEAAVARGVRLHFVFAARSPGYPLLRKHAGPALKRLVDQQGLSVEFVPDADHTYTRLDARARLVAVLDRLLLPTA